MPEEKESRGGHSGPAPPSPASARQPRGLHAGAQDAGLPPALSVTFLLTQVSAFFFFFFTCIYLFQGERGSGRGRDSGADSP